MKRSLLSILYICCITTLCCAAEKVNLKEMYAQLDKAISNAPYYKQQKETHINQQKLTLAKVRNGALGDRNEFEKQVKELGVLDRKSNIAEI